MLPYHHPNGYQDEDEEEPHRKRLKVSDDSLDNNDDDDEDDVDVQQIQNALRDNDEPLLTNENTFHNDPIEYDDDEDESEDDIVGDLPFKFPLHHEQTQQMSASIPYMESQQQHHQLQQHLHRHQQQQQQQQQMHQQLFMQQEQHYQQQQAQQHHQHYSNSHSSSMIGNYRDGQQQSNQKRNHSTMINAPSSSTSSGGNYLDDHYSNNNVSNFDNLSLQQHINSIINTSHLPPSQPHQHFQPQQQQQQPPPSPQQSQQQQQLQQLYQSQQSQPSTQHRSTPSHPPRPPKANKVPKKTANSQNSQAKSSKCKYDWLYVSGPPCYSLRQINSGKDLSNIKRKYKVMKCLYCEQHNPATPWASLKPRKYDTDTLEDHEHSLHHLKSLDMRQHYLAASNGGSEGIAVPFGDTHERQLPSNNVRITKSKNRHNNNTSATTASNDSQNQRVNVGGNPNALNLPLHSSILHHPNNTMIVNHNSNSETTLPSLNQLFAARSMNSAGNMNLSGSSRIPMLSDFSNQQHHQNIQRVHQEMLNRGIIQQTQSSSSSHQESHWPITEAQRSNGNFSHLMHNYPELSYYNLPTSTSSSQHQSQQPSINLPLDYQLLSPALLASVIASQTLPPQNQPTSNAPPTFDFLQRNSSKSMNLTAQMQSIMNNEGLNTLEMASMIMNSYPAVANTIPSTPYYDNYQDEEDHEPISFERYNRRKVKNPLDPAEITAAAIAYHLQQAREEIVDGTNFLRPKGRYSPPWLKIQGKFCFSSRQVSSGKDLSRTKKKCRLVMCSYCHEFFPETPWASMKARKFETAVFIEHERSLNHKKAEELKFAQGQGSPPIHAQEFNLNEDEHSPLPDNLLGDEDDEADEDNEGANGESHVRIDETSQPKDTVLVEQTQVNAPNNNVTT